MLRLTRPDRTPINCVDEWTRPKEDYQWKEGRSAMELAKAWFRSGKLAPPAELVSLLQSSKELQGLMLEKGIPEHVTPLPVRGEGRNHDLWLIGEAGGQKITICVEAKADEPFGNDTVKAYRAAGLQKRKEEKPTGVPERIEKLLALVSGATEPWDSIRYQLLTAITGTALQAKSDGAAMAVFVVHEFHTSSTVKDKVEQNAKDFDQFIKALGCKAGSIECGLLYGPFEVAGIRCLVGKTVVK